MKPRTRKIFNIYNWLLNAICVFVIVWHSISFEPFVPILMAIINEIMVNLDPISAFKGGRPLAPHDFADFW